MIQEMVAEQAGQPTNLLDRLRRIDTLILTSGIGGAGLVAFGLLSAYLSYGTLNPFRAARAASNPVTLKPEVGEFSNGQRSIEREGRYATDDGSLAQALQNRIASEIQMQDLKANLNLVIGSIAAMAGVIVLALTVFFPPKHDSDSLTVGVIFAARSLLSLTTSVFAFFFLTTYRRNLSEIRYFHNELTNVQSRLLAFEYFGKAIFTQVGDAEAAHIKMLGALMETERNFILKKGESTTDLYQKDLDRQEQAAWLAAALAAFKEEQKREGGNAKT
jgi:hypothetical protein